MARSRNAERLAKTKVAGDCTVESSLINQHRLVQDDHHPNDKRFHLLSRYSSVLLPPVPAHSILPALTISSSCGGLFTALTRRLKAHGLGRRWCSPWWYGCPYWLHVWGTMGTCNAILLFRVLLSSCKLMGLCQKFDLFIRQQFQGFPQAAVGEDCHHS